MQPRSTPARLGSAIVIAAMLSILLGGCGYKGPLYLPDETKAPEKT